MTDLSHRLATVRNRIITSDQQQRDYDEQFFNCQSEKEEKMNEKNPALDFKAFPFVGPARPRSFSPNGVPREKPGNFKEKSLKFLRSCRPCASPRVSPVRSWTDFQTRLFSDCLWWPMAT